MLSLRHFPTSKWLFLKSYLPVVLESGLGKACTVPVAYVVGTVLYGKPGQQQFAANIERNISWFYTFHIQALKIN